MRASRGWSLLVLVAILGVLGPPASASASDAGLRAVVKRDIAAEKRLDAAGRRVRAPSSKSFPAYIRFLRRYANHSARIERSVDGLHRRYRAQAPETADAARGRTLLLRGHRDVSNGAHETAVAVRRGIREMSRARSDGPYRRAYRRMVRVVNAQDARFRRGNSRIVRGRKLIRLAPAPPAPAAPTPPAPVAPAPAAPAPATPAPTAPAPLLPPLLPSLLGA
ncbi:hypothetical protein AB0L40_04175 [Patulibacter sp. NPDC049589]|uniref:hypothetical protein n=1 Tax=Patulibacter sp. NPDC049589 TaxID=3154731 RepID=UPI003441EFA9